MDTHGMKTREIAAGLIGERGLTEAYQLYRDMAKVLSSTDNPQNVIRAIHFHLKDLANDIDNRYDEPSFDKVA